MSLDSTAAPLSFASLLLNLSLGLGLSVILAGYYAWFGASLSNRYRFAPILPMVTVIVVLLLTIVKFSPALTLGLFSSMSIVRYRTAINNPEELVFLMFAVVIGLGLGTDQVRLTLIAYAVILLYMLIRAFRGRKTSGSHRIYYEIQLEDSQAAAVVFEAINSCLAQDCRVIKSKCADPRGSHLQVTCDIHVHNENNLVQLMDSLHRNFPTCTIRVIENTNLLGG